MLYEVADRELKAMHDDETYVCRRFSAAVHKAFRKVMNVIRAAADERDLRAMKSLRLEKLHGGRAAQHSMRLNDQFRLIVVFRTDPAGRSVLVVEIVDYH